MGCKSFFFAGGGTGGHIYPAVAIAEQIIKLQPDTQIYFFVSTRSIDSQILSKTNFKYTQLPAQSFSIRPSQIMSFCSSFLKSYQIAKRAIAKSKNPAVIGVGGFVAAPVCLAAHKSNVPIALLNVDIVPGRANKITARWARETFVQFEETKEYFAKHKAKVSVLGCPLRNGFENPQPDKVIEQLGLDRNKNILLITGASSGSENINEAVCSLLDRLAGFADDWQLIHLTGIGNYEKVKEKYAGAKIGYKVLRYFDDMADLLSASALVIGRSGAVSVAEYAAAAVPSICMPYPYHKDRHQYLNAGKLVEAGAGIIVDDLPDAKERIGWLWEELEPLLKDCEKREEMKNACRQIAVKDAASK
ncbi:MAG: hypothetical protein DRP62_02655, partial [Planctomycetota bacterium]